MWPVPFLTEGIVIGVVGRELWVRLRHLPLGKRIAANLILLGLLLFLAVCLNGCVSPMGDRPEPQKASPWMGVSKMRTLKT